jgi:hypothetical protein
MLDVPPCLGSNSENLFLEINLLMNIESLALVTEHVFLGTQEQT